MEECDIGNPVDFPAVVDLLPIGMALRYADGRVAFINSVARGLLFGETCVDADFDWRRTIDPNDRREFDTLVARALDQGSKGVATLRWEQPGRGSRWLRVNVGPWSGENSILGTIVLIEDVTPEVEARHAAERLAYMLDSTKDYVAVFRPDGSPLYVNDMTREVLQKLRDDGLDGRLTDLVEAEHLDHVMLGLFDEVERQGHWRGEFPLRTGRGETVPVSAVGVTKRDENGELEWIAFLGRDMSSEVRLLEQLRRQASVDPLTALANRSRAIAYLVEAVKHREQNATGVGVLYCDLDGFKPVNDCHGHSLGDAVLVAIARRLATTVRVSDLVARIGGDEFIIVMDDVAEADQLGALAERVIASLDEPVVIRSNELRVGVSIGIAYVAPTGPTTTADELLVMADAAMYEAKQSGGNTFRLVALDCASTD